MARRKMSAIFSAMRKSLILGLLLCLGGLKAFAGIEDLFSEDGQLYKSLPEINLTPQETTNGTGYVDRIKPEDLTKPVMRGMTTGKRPFFSLKVRFWSKLKNTSQRTLIYDSSQFSRQPEFVMTFFRRDQTNWFFQNPGIFRFIPEEIRFHSKFKDVSLPELFFSKAGFYSPDALKDAEKTLSRGQDRSTSVILRKLDARFECLYQLIFGENHEAIFTTDDGQQLIIKLSDSENESPARVGPFWKPPLLDAYPRARSSDSGAEQPEEDAPGGSVAEFDSILDDLEETGDSTDGSNPNQRDHRCVLH